MYPFLETIFRKQAQMPLLERHFERMQQTCKVHQLHCPSRIAIEQQLNELPLTTQTYKVRLFYGHGIFKIEAAPYHLRTIRHLKLMVNESLKYAYKHTQRNALERMHQLAGNGNEALIVQNGLFTDTTYANIACWDGNTWWTPAKPLLKGVRRAELLESGRIQEASIGIVDLPRIQKIALFNGMLDLGELVVDQQQLMTDSPR